MSEKSGPQRDQCLILIKAQPHRSNKYEETVCCAGVGMDGRWRRQYPVPFRVLADNQKFGRWHWIEYEFVQPRTDQRRESQKVDPDTIKPAGLMKKQERADFLSPLVKQTFDEADAERSSLTLIRPQSIRISSRDKSAKKLEAERLKHKSVSDQLSFLHRSVEPLEPCPKIFSVIWTDGGGKSHTHDCDDWETAAAFGRFSRMYGEEGAIKELRFKYEEQYFEKGLTLAFSTHSRRNIEYGMKNQWLLVGMIRLDRSDQGRLI